MNNQSQMVRGTKFHFPQGTWTLCRHDETRDAYICTNGASTATLSAHEIFSSDCVIEKPLSCDPAPLS